MNPVRVLGIETSSPVCSVALLILRRRPADFARALGEGGCVERKYALGKARHSEAVFELLDRVFRAAKTGIKSVDAVAVSLGPGSFTGLRIGLAVAKVLARFGGKRLVGVPTLAALAAQESVVARAPLYAAVSDAQRGELYAALYRRIEGRMSKVRGPWVCRPGDLEGILPAGSRTVYGPPGASFVAALGAVAFLHGRHSDPDRMTPLYVRRPEAVETLIRRMR